MKNLQASWFQNVAIFIAFCITFASLWAIWQLSGTKEEINIREQMWKEQISNLTNTINSLKAKLSASLKFEKINNQNKTFTLTRNNFKKAKSYKSKINSLRGKILSTIKKKNETVEKQRYDNLLTNLTNSQEKTSKLWTREIIEMERTLNENKAELKIIKSNLDSIAAFKLPPSQVMLAAQQHYKHPFSGVSPLLPNAWGVYPTINWQTLGGELNWFDEWNKLKNKTNGLLYLPPLILPNELGGWIVLLYLNWNEAFRLNGGIISQTNYNEGAPMKMNVTFAITLMFDNNNNNNNSVPQFNVNRMFTLAKSEWILNHLWKISSFMNNTWSIPSISVRVK